MNDSMIIQLPDLAPEFVMQSMSEVYDWGLLDLNIPAIHKQTMGRNIKIGIIDSGKSEHFETIHATKGAKNFTSSPVIEDRNGHSCLHPDGFVFTTNGLETIKEFFDNIDKPEICLDYDSYSKYVGDLNIRCISYSQHDGKFVEDVIHYVHKIPVVDEIYCIQFGDNRFVKLTHDHPTYVVNDKNQVEVVPCENIKVGDRLLCNNSFTSLAHDNLVITYGLTLQCQNCGNVAAMTKSHNGRKQCEQCQQSQIVEKPHTKELTDEWGYIVGFILTSGHVHYQPGSNFIQIRHSDMSIISHAKRFFEEQEYTVNVEEDKKHNVTTLTVCSKELCEFLINIGIVPGQTTRTQMLPKAITGSPNEVIFAFLAGIVDSAGSISDSGQVRIDSDNLDFCKQMTAFLTSIGLQTSGAQSVGNRWQIIIDNPFEIKKYLVSKQKNRLQDTGMVRSNSVQVTSITKELFNGYFYDFTTEQCHNYQGNGVIVSNTFVAGIIAAAKNNEGIIGVAPESELYFAKAMDDAGRGSPSAMVNAINWLIGMGVDIISISAGMFFDFKPLHRAVKLAHSKNIIIVAAAGNTGTRYYDVAFPARYPEVIGVAAYNQRHKIAPFSSRGINVAFAMPGVDIYSTHLNNQFVKSNGTSFACPMLSGVCALILSKHRSLDNPKTPCETPDQMMEHLKKYAIKLDDEKSAGFGTLDLEGLFSED